MTEMMRGGRSHDGDRRTEEDRDGKKNKYCCSSAAATRSTGLGLLEIPSPGGKIDPPGDGAVEMNEGGEPDRNLKLMLRLEKKRSVLYVLR